MHASYVLLFGYSFAELSMSSVQLIYIDLIQIAFGASLAKVVTCHEAKVERKEKYPRSDFLCPVLRLGKQVYQIRYFFTLSDQQPGSREAAGRGEGDVRHSA